MAYNAEEETYTQLAKASLDILQKHFTETNKPSTSQGGGDVERTLK
jgi:hypothetical protein